MGGGQVSRKGVWRRRGARPSADLTLCPLRREEEIAGLGHPWRDAEAAFLLRNPVLGFLTSLPYDLTGPVNPLVLDMTSS